MCRIQVQQGFIQLIKRDEDKSINTRIGTSSNYATEKQIWGRDQLVFGLGAEKEGKNSGSHFIS